MSDDGLLDKVQHVLCCPKGCRALAEGDLSLCGAKLTKEHAQAALDVCQLAYRDKIRALVRVRDEAGKLADQISEVAEGAGACFEPHVRAIAKIASDALH